MSPAPRLVAVVGPTATGKTELAVAVAAAIGGELVNADSRQTAAGLFVGTCTPTAAELGGVPAHLFGIREPGAEFTVADWLGACREVLAGLDARGVTAVLVGGTGLYLKAVIDGFNLGGAPDPDRRRAREQTLVQPGGLERLVEELIARDPDTAGLDLHNPRRVVRALELLDAHGPPLRRARRDGGERAATQVGVAPTRPQHAAWIAARAERMVSNGRLVAETEAALGRGVAREALERAGIGYREALALIDGQLDGDEAVTAIVHRTSRYAKAQRTWFRRDRRIHWLPPAASAPAALASAVIRLHASGVVAGGG